MVRISPPCWQEKFKYFPHFTVISVKMGHFKHQNLKTLIFFSWGRTPRPPTPFGPPLSNIPGGNPGEYSYRMKSACEILVSSRHAVHVPK